MKSMGKVDEIYIWIIYGIMGEYRASSYCIKWVYGSLNVLFYYW